MSPEFINRNKEANLLWVKNKLPQVERISYGKRILKGKKPKVVYGGRIYYNKAFKEDEKRMG